MTPFCHTEGRGVLGDGGTQDAVRQQHVAGTGGEPQEDETEVLAPQGLVVETGVRAQLCLDPALQGPVVARPARVRVHPEDLAVRRQAVLWRCGLVHHHRAPPQEDPAAEEAVVGAAQAPGGGLGAPAPQVDEVLAVGLRRVTRRRGLQVGMVAQPAVTPVHQVQDELPFPLAHVGPRGQAPHPATDVPGASVTGACPGGGPVCLTSADQARSGRSGASVRS